MKLLRGMRLDELPNDQEEGSWRLGLNKVINARLKSISNENGTDNVTPIGGGGFQNYPIIKLIGEITLNEDRIQFFGDTNPANSEVGILYSNNKYKVILKGNPLGFNENFPIQGAFEFKFNNNLVIAWTDNNKRIRILNTNCIPFKVNPDGTIPVGEQIKADVLLSLFPDYLTPIINRREMQVIEGAGSLLSGVYYPIVSYGYEDGSFTNWSKIYNAIPVYVDDKSLSINEVGGCDGGLATNKYIRIKFDNVDVNFKYLKIGYVYLRNGQTFAYEVKTYNIGEQSSIYVEYLGNENTIVQLNLDEVLIPNVIYERAKTITSLEKVLYIGNLNEPDDIDYQTYANEIQVGWIREFKDTIDPSLSFPFMLMNYAQDQEFLGTVTRAGYKNETTVFFDKSWKAGECYALYFAFKLTNGTYSKLFHIPGREAVAGDRDVMNSTNINIDDLDNGNNVYRYQIYNTATSNAPTDPYSGGMGFWENENEEYPLNDAGTSVHPDYFNIPGVNLANRKVRHHVFPDLSFLVNEAIGMTGPADFSLSGPTATYLKQTRNTSSVVPTDGSYYHPNFSTLGGSEGNNTLFTYTSIAGPNRAQFDSFAISDSLKLQFSFNQDYSKSRVGQSVLSLGGYWSIRLKIELNGSTFVEYFLEINSQVLDTSTLPSQSTTINVPVSPGDTVVVTYEIYTSIGTGAQANPFTYTNYFANMTATIGNYVLYGRPMGLTISNVQIPADLIGKVDSWEIFYAKRTNENLRIIGQDMLKNGRFHNFDLMTNRLPIKPSYIKPLLSYQIVPGPTTQIGDIPEYMAYNSLQEIPQADDLDSVSKFLYVGENTTSPVNNSQKASSIYCVAGNGQLTEAFIQTKYGDNNVLCDMVSYKRNMYKLFQEQEVFTTGIGHKITASGLQADKFVFGGDIHITPFGFRDRLDSTEVFNFLAEFVSNVNLRKEDALLGYTYFPKSGYPTPSWYGYNKDFNCNNEFNQVDIFYPVKECLKTITYHPNRIARSIVETNEGNRINWRTFKANSYYDTIRNKGQIWNILGGNRTLFIHLEYSLFIAQIKDKIATNTEEIYLGFTDVFDRPPYEVLSVNEGFAGTQSQFACILCSLGYCFIDRQAGKIFIYDGKLKEISDLGMFNYFDSNSQYIDKDIDNPFIRSGYTMAYDESLSRLIISKNVEDDSETGDKSFTISYYPYINESNGGWGFFHTYRPSYISYNRSGLYAVYNLNNQLHKHHSKVNKVKYYDGIVKDSYIEIVANNGASDTKRFDNINWISTTELNGVIFKKETFTHLMVYNDTQCSGIISLNADNGLWFGKDVKNSEDTWNFNNFRDLVKNASIAFIDEDGNVITNNIKLNKAWFDKSKFISKFVIFRIINNNVNQKTIHLISVDSNIKKSNI